jgi:hypothetical protein
VKAYDVRRTDGQTSDASDGKSSHGLWPGELKINQSINQSNINHLLLNNKVCVAAVE